MPASWPTLWFGFTHPGHDATDVLYYCASLVASIPRLDRGSGPAPEQVKAGQKKRGGARWEKKTKTKQTSRGRARVFVCRTVTAPFAIGAAANQIQCSRKKWCVHIKKLNPRVCVSEAEYRTTRGYYTHNGVGSHARAKKKAMLCTCLCVARMFGKWLWL